MNIQFDLTELQLLNNSLAMIINAGLDKEASKIIIDDIKKNCANGIDVNGNSFRPYTSIYAKKKKTTPNLKVTGVMLNSIEYDSNSKIITVDSSQEGKAEGNQKIREFIGVSDKAVTRIETELSKKIEDKIQGN